mgnify:CR=1 FL=1
MLIAPRARAQAFPSQPITLVVAWPAGGGSDVSMRLVADALSKKVGVPVVVVNKPGANGNIATEYVARAKPDAIVMHPGPINRGVEIDSAVADGGQSVILPQVTFGIAVRMAVMSTIAGNNA